MDRADVDVLLASPKRRELLEAVRASPGQSISHLARLTGRFWTSVRLDLESLERNGYVQTVRLGRRRLVFPRPSLDAEKAFATAILSEPSCRAVAATIAARPGVPRFELELSLDMSDRALYHHLKRLVAAGLVISERPRGYAALRPTALLEEALSEAPR